MGLKVFSTSTLRGKVSADNFTNAMPIVPSPGVVASLTGYTIKTETFTSNGTFFPKFNDRQFLNIEILVVGGGGSGGRTITNAFGDAQCGGGGAGQFIYIPSFRVPQSAGTSIAITIGQGGSQPGTGTVGNTGGNTTFGSLITALGGGGGGVYAGTAGTDGGSGGGSGSYCGVGYSAFAGSNTSTGGYPGGGNNSGGTNAGGGGGSGGSGNINGGGPGTTVSISGSAVTYAAGGNGNSGVVNGAANTGNGGSGSTSGSSAGAGAGGSGIIILRYFEK